MRISKRRSALFLFIFSCFGTGLAATVNASFPVIATVLAQIQLTVMQNMDFGNQTAGTAGDFPSTQPAQILVQGNANATVMGTFGGSSIIMTCPTGQPCAGDTITVDTFTCSGTGFNTDCTGTIPSNSQTTANISAVMHVASNDRAGNYTGTQTFGLTYS